jgi:hypothetical protein
MEIILPSWSSSSTQPVSMLNLQVLSSYFMFVSFLPYGTFTVVTFVIRFSDADRTQNKVLGAYRIESRYRLSTAKSSSAKRMTIRFRTHSRREGAGACRGKAPPSCWRKTALPLKSPTGAFIAAQPRHFSFRRKQKIRTLLLLRKGSDFHCLVRWKGLEPPAY